MSEKLTEADIHRQRTIVKSYIHEGYSEGEAVRLAAKLADNLEERARVLKDRRALEGRDEP